MPDELILDSDGTLRSKTWDSDRRGDCIIKKDGSILNEETKELVIKYNSMEEAEESFYNIEVVKLFTWDMLHCKITLPKDLKTKHIYDLIENLGAEDDTYFLKHFVELVYPYYKILPGSNKERITYGRYAEVSEDGYFSIKSICDGQIDPNSPETNLVFDTENFILRKNGETLFTPKESYYTLLDVFNCLFYSSHCYYDVILRKDGLYDAALDARIEDDPLKYLYSECTIEEGYTLKDMFEFVKQNEMLKLFLMQYSVCAYMEEYFEEAEKPYIPSSAEEREDIKELLIYTAIQISKYGIDYYTCFVGSTKEMNEYGFLSTYAMEMSPINEYVHLPVVLDTKVDLHSIKKAKTIQYGEVQVRYNLIDILNAIFSEISFFGSTKNRDATVEGLRMQVDEIKKEVDENGINSKRFKSVEEMLESLGGEDDSIKESFKEEDDE